MIYINIIIPFHLIEINDWIIEITCYITMFELILIQIR